MIEQLVSLDKKLFIYLNSFHSSWLDPVMLLITRMEFWLPLYAFLIFLIFKNYRREGWLVMAGAVLVIVLANVITGAIMKPYYMRLRPSMEPGLSGIVHLVNDYRGGLYGFASGHAANSLGVAIFCYLLFRNTYRWMGTIFIWAFVMTYSRIYLGVHYPGDILAGAIIGLISAYLGYVFYLWIKGSKSEKAPL